MQTEQQVCSFELATKLKELGVEQRSYFFWKQKGGLTDIFDHNFKHADIASSISAFTVSELGELLPEDEQIMSFKNGDIWFCGFFGKFRRGGNFSAKTEADARAKMLIYLFENKLIELPRIT